MDHEELGLKDKEIEKLTADLTKSGRRDFGLTFKKASDQMGEGALKIHEDGQMSAAGPTTQLPKNFAEPVVGAAVAELSAAGVEVMPSSDAEAGSAGPSAGATTDPETAASVAAEINNEGVKDILNQNRASGAVSEEQKELFRITRPLRTYERDIAETIREKNESVASVNMAAQKKAIAEGEKTPAQKTSKSHEKSVRAAQTGLILLVSFVLLLVSGSVFALGYYYFVANKPAPVVHVEQPLITTDQQKSVDISGLSSADAIAKISAALNSQPSPANSGSLVQVNVMSGTSTISAEEFLDTVAVNAPQTLVRAFGGKWILGYQNVGASSASGTSETLSSAAFFLGQISDFQNAWGGMLQWERGPNGGQNSLIQKNLTGIFIRPDTQFATSTSADTNAGSSFSDAIIQNKDVRELRDANGNIILLYAFVDRKTLLITTNENTFKEILSRYLSSQIVR